jgi:hypothetical protein
MIAGRWDSAAPVSETCPTGHGLSIRGLEAGDPANRARTYLAEADCAVLPKTLRHPSLR